MESLDRQRTGLKEVQVNTYQTPTKSKKALEKSIKVAEDSTDKDTVQDLKLQIEHLKLKNSEQERIVRLQRETINNLKTIVQRNEENSVKIQHAPHKGIFWEEK
eukprot:gene5754-9575_t